MNELNLIGTILQGSPSALVLLVAWVIYLRSKPKNDGVACAEHDRRMALMEKEQKDRNEELQEFKRDIHRELDDLKQAVTNGFIRINERIDSLLRDR